MVFVPIPIPDGHVLVRRRSLYGSVQLPEWAVELNPLDYFTLPTAEAAECQDFQQCDPVTGEPL